MDYETIKLSVGDRVATVTLNRPDALNAISSPLVDEFTDAVSQVKGVAVYVASGWAFGRVTFWENAVYAANSVGDLQCIPT